MERSKKKHKILVRLLFPAILGILIGINFYTGKIENLTDNRMPTLFGYGFSVVLSESMEPVLSVNDIVVVRETQEVAVGDIIVYERDGDLIVHRIVSVDGDTLITQGDANDVADEPIDISAVRGKMVRSVPAVGGVIRAVKAPIAAVAARFRSGDEASGSAQAAVWVVEAVADIDHADLTASTESPTIYYPFSIRNYRGDVVCEVAAEYEITVELPDMDPSITLNLKLIEEDEDGQGDILAGKITSGGSYTFSAKDGEFAFAAGEKETHKFTIELSDTAGQIKAETVIRDIRVKVTAVQSKE